MKRKGNKWGIWALFLSFLSPLVGVILAIISLNKKEDSEAFAIIAICISALNFILALIIL